MFLLTIVNIECKINLYKPIEKGCVMMTNINFLTNDIKKTGAFNSGWNANATGQIKKSASQMTNSELDYLTYLINDMNSFRIHKHLKKKRDEGMISFDILIINNTLRSPNLKSKIKEYSENINHDGVLDRRVLIRSKKHERVFIKGKGYQYCNLIFVISLDTSEIVTAYYVNKNKKYSKLNKKRYDQNLRVISGGAPY